MHIFFAFHFRSFFQLNMSSIHCISITYITWIYHLHGMCQVTHAHWSALYDQVERLWSNKWRLHCVWYDVETSLSRRVEQNVSVPSFEQCNQMWFCWKFCWKSLRLNRLTLPMTPNKIQRFIFAAVKLEELIITELSFLWQCSTTCWLEGIPHTFHSEEIDGWISSDCR